jgi:hypothetical protein
MKVIYYVVGYIILFFAWFLMIKGYDNCALFLAGMSCGIYVFLGINKLLSKLGVKNTK